MATFLGEILMFKIIDDYLPGQKGKIIEPKDYQEEAINNLEEMREKGDSIVYFIIQQVQVKLSPVLRQRCSYQQEVVLIRSSF